MSETPTHVWIFDSNHRVYAPRLPGEAYGRGGPIWREHWRKRSVVGETRVSWVLDNGVKVPKKRNVANDNIAFSEAEIDRRAWVQAHRFRIARAIERTSDYDALSYVAAIMNYDDTTEK